MIEVIFSIDYEIYGNGEGSLKDLVYEPTRKLIRIFDGAGAKLVVFTEVGKLILRINNCSKTNPLLLKSASMVLKIRCWNSFLLVEYKATAS